MNKFLLFIGGVLLCTSLSAQSIFKGLETGMSQKEAKAEFRANRDDYINIEIGNGFAYRIYQQNFQYVNDGLVAMLLTPKGSALGQGYDEAASYLDFSDAFFQKLNYEEFFRPEYWNAPQSFSSKYGLLLSNPDKTIMVQMYPTKYKSGRITSYLVKLHLYNYDQFMEWYDKEHEAQEEIAEKSGF